MKALHTSSWRHLAIGILGGLLGAAILLLFNGQPRGEAVSILPPPSPAPIRVHVTGAVSNPDVYSLPPGSRVQDAVDAAAALAACQSISIAFQPSVMSYQLESVQVVESSLTLTRT